MKLVNPIKMCVSENYSKVRVGKNLLPYSLLGMLETRRCFNAIAFQTCFRVRH